MLLVVCGYSQRRPPPPSPPQQICLLMLLGGPGRLWVLKAVGTANSSLLGRGSAGVVANVVVAVVVGRYK